MITSIMNYRVQNVSKGGRQGRILVPASVSHFLRWKAQKLGVIIFERDEKYNEKVLLEQIKVLYEFNKVDQKADLLKEKFCEVVPNDDNKVVKSGNSKVGKVKYDACAKPNNKSSS